MSQDVQALKSYLVALGFSVNSQQFTKFESTLKDASRLVDMSTSSIVKSLFKWEIAATGAFVSISGAILGMMDKVAMADQTYRLFGERMFMNTANARGLKIALDALGQPLEAIAFDPELYGRFTQLQRDQKTLTGELGGASLETSLKGIRDIRFEFTRFEVELQYFATSATQEIFKALGLGSGDLLKTLKWINDYIIANIPKWGKEFAQDVVPILKDTWDILKAIGVLSSEIAVDFTNLVGAISGDSSLETQTLNFHKFARAIEDVAHWTSQALLASAGFIRMIAGSAVSVIDLGVAAGKFLAGDTTGAKQSLNDAADSSLNVVYGANDIGAAIFGTGVSSRMRDILKQSSTDILNPNSLASAVSMVESGGRQFDSNGNVITSNKGAIGLMQLMPGTAAGLGVNPYDPQQNAMGGEVLLRSLRAHYKGNIENTLAAYNWGQGNVDKALAAGKPFPASVNDYIRKVEKGYFHPSSYHVGSGSSSVTIGAINITQPGASAEQIAQVVTQRVQDAHTKRTQRQISELSPIYG